MRLKVLFFSILWFLGKSVDAQEKFIISINQGQQMLNALPATLAYSYQMFKPGQIYYQDGKSVSQRLNHHVFFDKIQWLNAQGDTIDLDEGQVKYVVIENDTIFRDKFLYRIVKTYGLVKLLERTIFSFYEKQPSKGDSSSYKEEFRVIADPLIFKNIITRDTLRLARFPMYYLADERLNIGAVRREFLINLYPDRKEALLGYLKKNPVHANDREEIEGMLRFLIQH